MINFHDEYLDSCRKLQLAEDDLAAANGTNTRLCDLVKTKNFEISQLKIRLTEVREELAALRSEFKAYKFQTLEPGFYWLKINAHGPWADQDWLIAEVCSGDITWREPNYEYDDDGRAVAIANMPLCWEVIKIERPA